MRKLTGGSLAVAASLVSALVVAQERTPTPLLKQIRNGEPAIHLTNAELESLGDPFFNLVLRDGAPPTTLADIVDRITGGRPSIEVQLFAVSEELASHEPGPRRGVIAFSGFHPVERNLAGNVMLSVFYDSRAFAEQQIEAWGWDNHRGRYNYYKLDRSGTPLGQFGWKFRGSSVGSDLLSPDDRRETCFACHVNGAPVMKELLFPWNNWHSFASQATYLLRLTAAERRWPIASHPLFGGLAGAETLENDHLLPALAHFNTRRINDVLERDDESRAVREEDGLHVVVEGRRILKPLFVTTEVNLISSGQPTGLHPLSPPGTAVVDRPVGIPNSLFLNDCLLRALGIREAAQFQAASQHSLSVYRESVEVADLRLAGRAGDAIFAWFVPEPSSLDCDLGKQLLARGVVTPTVVAALLAVDLRTPIFSPARRRLWQELAPERFTFPSGAEGARGDQDLEVLLVAALTAIEQRSEHEELLLSRLTSGDAVALLREDVARYLEEVRGDFSADATSAVRKWLGVAIARRQAMLDDVVLRSLDETQGFLLLPLPPRNAPPGSLSTEGHRTEEPSPP